MKIRSLVLLTAIPVLALGHLQAQSSAAVTAESTPLAAVTAGERQEATGTITDVTPGRSMVLHTGVNAGEPMIFRFAPEVTYVDSDGKTIEAAGLRKNLRVRVSYVKSEGANIIDKVTILQ
ncbi:hypothetical protein BH20VER2_BH20VER2_14050 [soil metagenome]|nr:hypothetical protein [Chthoniobacterales bacterium]